VVARDPHDDDIPPAQPDGGDLPPHPADDPARDPVGEPPLGKGGGKGPDLAQVLVSMAEDTYKLIRADDGRTYAVPKLGPNIAVPLASKTGNGVRAKLAASLRRRSGQVASGSALSDCINVLEGEAAELDPQPVFLRVGRHHTPPAPDGTGGGEAIVVDMGTETGQCLLITRDGWRIEAESPVIFRRSELIHPMVEPVRGGTLDGLRALINLSEEDYRLAIGWAVAAYFTDIPHPILFVQGEQGTAKSNLIRSLLSLIDPQPAADREAPSSQREWAIFARASWAFSFDNVTEIPEWLSNSLCKGVTGDAVLQRALHSDEDIVVFSFQRVIAMTTIAIKHALAGDLVDRMLLVEPEVLDVRLSEAQVRAARETALPNALGAVLDLVAAVLRALSDVHPNNLPRMADFARVLAALDQVTGWETLPTYRDKVAAMSAALIEGNTFAQALYRFAARPGPDGQPTGWEGTAGELLEELRALCLETGMPHGDLPDNGKAAGLKISEIAPSLRKVGVDIRRRKSGARRLLQITINRP
jgi:hypothetical protein